MATTALSTLRQELSSFCGTTTEGIATFTTTTNIGAGLTVISTQLPGAGYTNDDTFNDWWVWITGTANSQVARRVSDYTGASGTITVPGANLSAESGSATFELHTVEPRLLRTALNDARLLANKYLYVPVHSEVLMTATGQQFYSIPSSFIQTERPKSVRLGNWHRTTGFSDNILQSGDDPSFEDWASSSSLTKWVAVQLTLAQETYSTAPTAYGVLQGTYAVRALAAASQTCTLLRTVSNGTNYAGKEINFGLWVYSKTASRIKARIDEDGVTTDTTTAHTGTGWEFLSVSRNIGNVTTLKVGLVVSSGAAFVFYCDEAIGTAGPSEFPQPAYELLQGWEWRQVSTSESRIYFPYQLPERRPLLIEGRGYLSSVSAEADTMEITAPQTRVLYAFAGRELANRWPDGMARPKRMERDWDMEVQKAVGQYAMADLVPQRYPKWWGR